jgi:PAS domain S-box-containing protein
MNILNKAYNLLNIKVPQGRIKKTPAMDNPNLNEFWAGKTLNRDEEKTREELIKELKDLRLQIAEAESSSKLLMGLCESQRDDKAVTEEKERAAANERAKTEGIIAAIGDGIRIIDTNFRIVYENQRHKELLGDHVGEYCFSAYRQRDQECEMCPLVVTFEEGLIHKAERVLSRETVTKHLGLTASPIRDASGRIIASVVVVRDITDRKLIEAEREELIVELQEALAKIKTLRGLIPTCAWCRKVRDDKGYWNGLEKYIRENSDANFTHGICPECLKKNEPEIYNELLSENDGKKVF